MNGAPNNTNFIRYPSLNLTEQDVAEYLSNFEQRQDPSAQPPNALKIDSNRMYYNPVPFQAPHPWNMYYPPYMSKPSYHIPFPSSVPPGYPPPPPQNLKEYTTQPKPNLVMNNMSSPPLPTERRPSTQNFVLLEQKPDQQNNSGTNNTISNSVPSTSDDSSEPKSLYQVIFRNLFHIINSKIDKEGYEGYRIYVVESLGYSGNAKRFKKKPEKGENALYLNCSLSDAEGKLITQCLACKDYFETQKYFKANPECMGRVALIKNNAPIVIERGEFKLLVKIMCCCAHHTMDAFYFSLTLTDPESGQVVLSCKVPICVKQWRKSNQKKEDANVSFT